MDRRAKNRLFLWWTVLCLALIVVPVFGHHGTGITYDQDKSIVVKGVVTEFVWKNPHSQLYMDVKDDKGKTVAFAIEMNSPGVMTRQGWTRHQFKAGDQVVITVHPSKFGTPIGECLNPCKVVINGKEPQ